MNLRRALFGLARLAVGASILAYLLTRSDGALDIALREDLGLLFVVASGHLAALVVGAFRWRAYLGALEAPVGARAVAGLAAGGAFFNAFLPTGVGGDAFKAVRLVRAGYERTAAFGSVLLDRLSGLVGLAVLAFLAGVVLLVNGAGYLGAIPLATLTLALVIFGAEMGLALAGSALARLSPVRIRDRVREAAVEMRAASRHPDRVVRGYGLGVLAQVFVVAAHIALSVGLDLGVDAATITCAVALAQVAALVPVTINGAGLREATYVWVLTTAGVPHQVAVAFGIVNLGSMLLASLIAGGFYVIAGARVTPVTRA